MSEVSLYVPSSRGSVRGCAENEWRRVLGFGLRGLGLGLKVSVRVFRVSGFGFRISGFGFPVSGFEFQVSSLMVYPRICAELEQLRDRVVVHVFRRLHQTRVDK